MRENSNLFVQIRQHCMKKYIDCAYNAPVAEIDSHGDIVSLNAPLTPNLSDKSQFTSADHVKRDTCYHEGEIKKEFDFSAEEKDDSLKSDIYEDILLKCDTAEEPKSAQMKKLHSIKLILTPPPDPPPTNTIVSKKKRLPKREETSTSKECNAHPSRFENFFEHIFSESSLSAELILDFLASSTPLDISKYCAEKSAIANAILHRYSNSDEHIIEKLALIATMAKLSILDYEESTSVETTFAAFFIDNISKECNIFKEIVYLPTEKLPICLISASSGPIFDCLSRVSLDSSHLLSVHSSLLTFNFHFLVLYRWIPFNVQA